VHFIPVPMMSYYKRLGYAITNYPVTFDNYSREISLPVYYEMNAEIIQQVVDAVAGAVQKVMG
jgi:dTDP-4-amino-4,6-dideoxygalactose transaminase